MVHAAAHSTGGDGGGARPGDWIGLANASCGGGKCKVYDERISSAINVGGEGKKEGKGAAPGAASGSTCERHLGRAVREQDGGGEWAEHCAADQDSARRRSRKGVERWGSRSGWGESDSER